MKEQVRRCALGACLSVLLAVATSARADIIVYNNFGAGDSYQTSVGWTVGNDFSGDNIAIGETFTPSTTGTLSRIVVALNYAFGTNAATISLQADAGGVPGAVLESFSVSNLPPLDGNYQTPTTVTDATNAALVAGTPYWVVASTTTDSSLGWMLSDSATGSHATSFDGGATWSATTDSQAAFRVTENVPQSVPEPSTFALLGIGMAAGGWLRRRTRNRTRRHCNLNLESLEDRNLMTITATPVTALMPGDFPGTMMLLPNGAAMVQGSSGANGTSPRWYSLTPNASGSYVSGTWGSLGSMHVQRLYFGSVVLPSDQVLVVGGEYSGSSGSQNITNTGEIYSMATNSWSNIANFPQSAFGDDPLTVIAAGPHAGDVLGGYIFGPQTYSYSVSGNNWTQRGTKLANDRSDEEGWIQLPGGKILSYNVFASPGVNAGTPGSAQVYDPVTDKWTATGSVPVGLTSSNVPGDSNFLELGPGLLLPPTAAHPQGLVFFVGATGSFSGSTYTSGAHTALYDPISNTWTAGPNVPVTGYAADDAPGAVLPDGNVLFTGDTPAFNKPSKMFEYNPTANTITDVTATLPAGLVSQLNTVPAFVERMLSLPSGQVLFSDDYNQLWTLSETGTINSAWRPKIFGIANTGAGTFTLTGQQLNGMNEGAAYGDDVEMSSNYPIVRLVQTGTGTVYYATTSNWSQLGVQTGTTMVTTNFKLPTSLKTPGTYVVTVIANGIPSTPATLSISAGELPALSLPNLPGSDGQSGSLLLSGITGVRALSGTPQAAVNSTTALAPSASRSGSGAAAAADFDTRNTQTGSASQQMASAPLVAAAQAGLVSDNHITDRLFADYFADRWEM
jgi:hypothetical protein